MNQRLHLDHVAVIGMAFRFPGGAESEKKLWDALIDGEDLVSEIDNSRWAVDTLQHPKRSEPGRSITFSAGVLSRIDAFDAAFFGISPREAELLDPQQRILLELAWEAMEHAGVRPSSLAGTPCAVYVGMSALDYGMRLLDDLSSFAAHSMTGNTMSVAANRLSYVFDLHGPSLAIDTACSSSLVALHHACNALASGQASAALVGGVNVLLHPYPFVGFTKASMLSAQGRCRPFAEGGDGYVRAEGGAVLLLKPLSEALAEGNRVLAVIRASGVNADGGRKSGLTIPSVDGQTELLRSVLAKAGLQPDDVDFLEAHGTGTKIGDPIEAEAIGRVYGVGRPAHKPLPIGSIKGNLGHMEPASGMGGMVKAILALRHATLPPSLHADPPNPAIDFSSLGLQVVRQPMALAQTGRPLRAAVNSFGFGGVNAHVILEQYAPSASSVAAPSTSSGFSVPLVLSAHDERALQTLALQYLPCLSDPARRAAVAQAAWEQREWLPERLAVVDLGQARGLDALAAYAEGESTTDILRERALGEPAHVAFVYSGNGAQWVGMGRVLQKSSPVFAQALTQASLALQSNGGPDIEAALADNSADALDDTALAQPAMFAIQVALTQLLRSLGVHATAATGHSVGEIAAAWAVGGLSLETAARVIVERSRAQALTRGTGRMAAVGMSAQAMRARLEALNLADRVELAAENSPRNITVSATPADLQLLREALRPAGTVYRELDLDYAFHSRFMQPIEAQIKSRLAAVHAQDGMGTFYSTVTGDALDTRALDAGYWWRNVREPVRFGPAISRMIEAGYRVFIEIAPHAILQRYIGETLDAQGVTGRSLFVAKRQAESLAQVQEAALRAALLGATIDASVYFAQSLREHVELPTYPWQRQRYWYKATSERYAIIERAAVHPLLGYRLKEFRAAWENHLDPLKHPWLADHKVGGAVVLPGAAYVDMALAASREWFGGDCFVLENLDIIAPVVFDGEHARTLRLIFTPHDLRFRIEGRQRLSDDAWSVHAQGRLLGAPAHTPDAPARIATGQGAVHVQTAAAHYALAERLGLQYGPGFRGIERLHVDGDTLAATLAWPPGHAPEGGFVLHPAVLDQAFQSVLGWFAEGSAQAPGLSFLPVGIGRLLWRGGSNAPVASLHAHLVRHNPRSVLVDFELLDAQGGVVATLQGCRFRAAALQLQDKAPACWATTLRLEPLDSDPALGGLPPSGDIAQAVLAFWQGSEAAAAQRRYLADITPLVEQLPLAFARDALRADAPDGDAPRAHTLARWRDGHPLLHWLLDRLYDDGLLSKTSHGWTAAERDLPAARAIWETVLADCPAALPELLQLGRVGLNLGKLASDHDIAGALDHASAHSMLESQAPVYAFANHALAQAVATLAKRWPANRRLRILDIGNDDGGLYNRLQVLLPQARVDVVIARCDPQDLAHLQAETVRHDRVSVAALDPSTFDLTLPSGAPAVFDLVLVHQVLHQVGRPARALANLQRHMATDAVLLLAEREPDQASQLLFGARASWWHRNEAGTLQGSLLDTATWQSLLQDAGWTDRVVVQSEPASGTAWGSVLLLARPPHREVASDTAAARPRASWSLRADHDGWQPLAHALRDALRSQGQAIINSPTDCGSTADHRVVFPDLPQACASAAHVARVCDDVRRLLLDVAGQEAPPQVVIVTRGGALASDASEAASPSAAALWGLVRVARNEYPHLRVRLIDLQLDPSAALAAAAGRLALEVLDGGSAEEIVLTSSGRYAPRLRPTSLEAPTAGGPPAAAWTLDFTLAG
ncbi:MAG: acyltransferase domain-containing protein, partial [Betaproteobacteria bacterium]|nr:acyltransferase domain-containing protein [Betaproteobacteria bacterium]